MLAKSSWFKQFTSLLSLIDRQLEAGLKGLLLIPEQMTPFAERF
jgi:hypothetical protein